MIVRLPNHLGDACMASPALDLLAARGHALTLVGRGWARDLYAGYPWPMVALPDERLARVRALVALRRRLPRATPALLLTNSFSSALEMRLGGLRPIGYDTDRRGWLLARSIPVPERWAGDMHTVEYYHWLARCVIDRPVPAPTRIELRLAPAAYVHARWALEAPAPMQEATWSALCFRGTPITVFACSPFRILLGKGCRQIRSRGLCEGMARAPLRLGARSRRAGRRAR